MKFHRLIAVIPILCFMLSGCSVSDISIGPKNEVTSYEEKALKVKQPLELYIGCDSGNIEIYGHEGNMVKFEMTKKVRGLGKKDQLEKQLAKCSIIIRQDESKVYYQSGFGDRKINPFDKSMGLKIYIPRKIKSISFELDAGSIKIYDDIKCDMKAGLNTVDVSINRFEGSIQLKGKIGNVTVGNGRITGTSSINEEIGNIDIKAAFDENGSYMFKTGTGNINLLLPSDASIGCECTGTVETNDFPPGSGTGQIKAVSDMGKIAVKKY